MLKPPQVGKIYRFRNYLKNPFIFITRLDIDKGVYYYFIVGDKHDKDHYGYLDSNLAYLEEI